MLNTRFTLIPKVARKIEIFGFKSICLMIVICIQLRYKNSRHIYHGWIRFMNAIHQPIILGHNKNNFM